MQDCSTRQIEPEIKKMPSRKTPPVPEIEIKFFANIDEIDRAILKLQRRKQEVEQIDFVANERDHTGVADVAKNNLRDAILEVFGPNSPEYRAHKHISFWAGPMNMNMRPQEILQAKISGGTHKLSVSSTG